MTIATLKPAWRTFQVGRSSIASSQPETRTPIAIYFLCFKSACLGRSPSAWRNITNGVRAIKKCEIPTKYFTLNSVNVLSLRWHYPYRLLGSKHMLPLSQKAPLISLRYCIMHTRICQNFLTNKIGCSIIKKIRLLRTF